MTPTIIRIDRNARPRHGEHRGAGLLMSATLVPPVQAVARANPDDRLGDYLDALRFYLSLPDAVIDRILFVDNSHGDLTPLADLARNSPHQKSVELIGFQGNDHPYQLGKAYGEFRLMDFGLAHSTLFTADDLIWKTSGRLKFLNLPAMSKRCRDLRFDVLCDLHNVPGVGSGRWRDCQAMDLRVFAFRRQAYDALLRDIWCTYTGGLDQGVMYDLMRRNATRLRIVPRFPLQPRLQGISGRHQRDYQSSSQRAKDGVRGAMRRVCPWLWL